MATHFDYLIDGELNMAPYLNGSYWAKYLESSFLYAPQVYPFNHDVATSNGFPIPENMLLHINQDYTVGSGYAWQGLDQFDYFEQPGYLNDGSGATSAAINGAFTLAAGVYTDVTAKLYTGAYQITIANTLLLGYAEPFDLVNVNVLNGQSGGTVTWQYWNGQWNTLAPSSDTTNSLATSGTMQFTPPGDWIPTIVNGSRSKYWIQAVVAGATSNPVLSRVYGDNWLSQSGTNNIRGWSATDPNRVNIGMGNLEYNPTPPPTATARFRYQARATGIWAPNAMFGNPADVQNNQNTWAASRLANFKNEYAAVGLSYNSAFLDDGGAQPTIVSPVLPIESLSDLGLNLTWNASAGAMLSTVRSEIQSIYGSNFQVGINESSNGSVAMLGDFSLDELVWGAPLTGNIPYTSLDAYLPATNPLNTNGIFAAWDNGHFGGILSGYAYRWDNSNRSPIAIMASQLIGGNPNVSMEYNTLGWSYVNTDEVYYWSATTTTLASAVNADSSTSSKALVLTNDSVITLPGGPIWNNATVATSASQAANIYGYAFKIGNDVIQPFRDSSNHWHTYTPILSSYPAGTVVKFSQLGHQATNYVPFVSNVWYWATYFPALSTVIGPPNPSGWKGGVRDTNYIPATGAGNPLPYGPGSGNPPVNCTYNYACPEWWRRDFTNAIVIAHVFHDGNNPAELDTYGPVVPIQLGGTYYPLLANGTTGTGIQAIQMRAGEAAILMTAPVFPKWKP